MNYEEVMRRQMLKETNDVVAGIIAKHKPMGNDLWVILKLALAIMIRLRRFLRTLGNEKDVKRFLKTEVTSLRKLDAETRKKIVELIVDAIIIR